MLAEKGYTIQQQTKHYDHISDIVSDRVNYRINKKNNNLSQ